MPKVKTGCAVKGCTAPGYATAKDINTRCCKKHYTQVARHGRLVPERERGVIRVCAADRCGRTDTVGIYCRKHARQYRTHGKLTPDREHQMGNVGCKTPGCTAKHRARGLCVKHYNAQRWKSIKQVLQRVRDLDKQKGGL